MTATDQRCRPAPLGLLHVAPRQRAGREPRSPSRMAEVKFVQVGPGAQAIAANVLTNERMRQWAVIEIRKSGRRATLPRT